jgi:plastocyanin
VEAGLVEVELKNSGRQVHDAILLRIDGAHSIEEILDILGSEGAPIPPWLHAEGGVAAIAPGTSQSATMILPPGRYYLVDNQTDANNNAFAKAGGVKELTVTGQASGDDKLPSADVTFTTREYSFGISEDLKAGTHTVKFDNVGSQLHHVLAFPLLPGKTIDDVRQAFASQDQNTPPPVDFQKATGVEVLDGGKALVTKMTFEKGSYAFICFLSDRSGGPPHFALGMLQEVKVA